MKKIAVVTTTRAEYGLLAPIIKRLRDFENPDLKVELIVSGTHLYKEYGMTVNEIRTQSVRIDHEVLIPVNSHSAIDISNNQAAALTKFAELFSKEKYSALLILGDRYEMLAVAMAASNTRIPIFHISGGDVTEGAIDDCIRHAITKMSYLHFTTNEESRKRVIQLGEEPDRVFNYGSTSIDNILNMAVMSKREAMDSVGVKKERYALCTYHPVTLEDGNIKENMDNFLAAIKSFDNIEFIVTKSNADQGGEAINRILDEESIEIPNLYVYSSLGVKRYLSLMKYAQFVMGNSSSGIVEAPAFHIPTVNIGDRQRGRLQAESIINCTPDCSAIVAAMEKALSVEIKNRCKSITSPYGDGCSAERVVKKMMEVVGRPVDLKKRFFDIEVSV